MKTRFTLVLLLLCLLCFVGCSAEKLTCREISADDAFHEGFSETVGTEPFVAEDQRDALLTDAIADYLAAMDQKDVPFTYEITGTHTGTYDHRDTVLYWVSVAYGEGFTFLTGFIIQ